MRTRVAGRYCVVVLAALAALAVPSLLPAQRLVGEVLRADSITPAVRTLVEWRDVRGNAQRTATDNSGRFTVVLEAAGNLTLRVLRPGFRPQVLPARTLARGQVDSLRIVLRDDPIALPTVTVEEDHICGARGEGVAWQLWEQARVALQSVVLAERDTALRVEAVEYEADHLPGDSVLVRDSTVARVGLERPKPPIHYDSLFRYGYVRRVADTSSYFSPTLPVITDERFAEHYCFSRVVDEERRPDWIGVSFAPARRPGPGIADVVGTFWLDRERLLLREVTYEYINVPVHHRIAGLGGELRFTELASGHWILSDWVVRMPTIGYRRRVRAAVGIWSKTRTVSRVTYAGRELYRDRAPEQWLDSLRPATNGASR